MKKKQIYLLTALLITFFLIIFIFLVGRESDEQKYHKICSEIFRTELLQDTLSMHYTVADPANYGIGDYTSKLPNFNESDIAVFSATLENQISALSKINASRLNQHDRFELALLLSYLEKRKSGIAFSYYGEPLSPNSGVQSQLPILLAEYTLDSKKDIEDYLDLLECSASYLASIEEYERIKSEKGLFMADYSVDKVIEQCDSILDRNSLDSGEHFLITTFEERLDNLVQQNIISEAEKAAYLSENNNLLVTVVQPAFEHLGDTLLILKGTGKNEQGLCYLENGKEYYEFLLKSSTGSSKSIQEMKNLLYERIREDYQELAAISSELRKLAAIDSDDPQKDTSYTFFDVWDSVDEFLLTDASDMLQDLQEKMNDAFPSFSDGSSDVTCTIKSVSRNLEKYVSPAFYLTPPIDDFCRNVIYINEYNHPYGLELYTTLAHEGYPGHLYQTVYFELVQNETTANPIRSILYYGGYVEGWALYVESLSYEYAKELNASRSDNELRALYYDISRLDRDIQLCLYSLLDIMIHYDGISYEEVSAFIMQFGVASDEVARHIYEYIVEEPANYPKYYIGFLELSACKEEAKTLWGNMFSDYNFHRFIMETGPVDFDHLRKALKDYSIPDSEKYISAYHSL